MGFSGIDWTKVDSTSFEDLIQALIVETHPGAVAMDGSGGDGGRDVELAKPERRVFFDAKYFPEPLRRTQRRQVERALKSVAKHGDVDEWILVVPRNHNPAEKQWFEDLELPICCTRQWLGETWIGVEVAKRPYLSRAYLKTQTEETLRLLAEYHAEQAALTGGVSDLLGRHQNLAALGDTLDPDYTISLGSDKKATYATLVPRKDQARPLRVTVNFTNPASRSSDSAVAPDGRPALEQQFKALYEYGDPMSFAGSEAQVDIHLPVGGRISFGGADEPAVHVYLSGAETRADPGYLEAQTSRGRSLVRLPITFNERQTGVLAINSVLQTRPV